MCVCVRVKKEKRKKKKEEMKQVRGERKIVTCDKEKTLGKKELVL